MRFEIIAGMIVVASCRQTESTRSVRGATKTTAVVSQGRHPHDATPPKGHERLGEGVASSEPTSSPPSPKGLQPLRVGTPFIALPVTGFRDAVVSTPEGATEPRPLVIALHGNFDRPEWQCEVWRGVSSARPFILCPRGSPRTDVPRSEDRWTYDGLQQTVREIEAGIQALQERFAAYVDARSTVLVAFSLGAICASRFAVDHADQFPRLVLIEGGYEGWKRSRVARFAEKGGERVLIACAQTVCRNAARDAERVFAAGGVDYRFTYAAGAGHTYDGEVARQIAEQWDWLTQLADGGP